MKQIQVKQGDCIERLALTWFGDWKAWDWLYHTNKEIIGDDPFELKSGILLSIKDPLTVEKKISLSAQTTWFDLALEHYGYGELWSRLSLANPGIIPESMGLYDELTVTIPPIVTRQQINDAAYRRDKIGG